MATFPKKVDNWNDPYADLDSIFDHMNDTVLSQYYQVFGVDSKDDFIVSKEARDASPCQYRGSGPELMPGGNIDPRQADMVGTLE